MTEEKDGPVHYQVSVTGRQAAAFFLVLLASLGLSFFFGMKTGAAARRGPDAVSALAAQSDIPVPATAFGADTDPKAVPVPTEVPIGFEAVAPEPRRAPAGKATPPAREEPLVVVRELDPTPAPPKPVEAAAKADEGPLWVQILVTSSARKADELSKKLKADGFRPDVSVVPGKEGLFRVRIGPYPDRGRAEDAAKGVEKAEKLQTKPIIVPGK